MNDTVPSNTPDPMTFISEGVADIGVYVAMWDNRQPIPAPTRAARLAADQAVERIDATVKRLLRLRDKLIAEVAVEDARWLALDEPERWTDTGSGPGHDETEG